MTIETEGWACACVKRGPDGNLTHIKINSQKVKKCHICGCVRPEAQQ